jgi:predicted nucleotidyltransferase
MQRLDASALRRNFFQILKQLDAPIEILRNGRVDAVLIPPPTEARAEKPQFEPKRLARICQKHGIKKIALFGSGTRDDFRPDSDVDVLIELLPQRRIRLKSHVRIVTALTDLFGREVDMHYFEDLERADAETKKSIARDLRVIYAL